jgi:hypothetical protein
MRQQRPVSTREVNNGRSRTRQRKAVEKRSDRVARLAWESSFLPENAEVRVLIEGSEVVVYGNPAGLKYLAEQLLEVAESADKCEHAHLEPITHLSKGSLWLLVCRYYSGKARGAELPEAYRQSQLEFLPRKLRGSRSR